MNELLVNMTDDPVRQVVVIVSVLWMFYFSIRCWMIKRASKDES
jgi:hypothetical protein